MVSRKRRLIFKAQQSLRATALDLMAAQDDLFWNTHDKVDDLAGGGLCGNLSYEAANNSIRRNSSYSHQAHSSRV
jgi:hypothetical protein